METSIKHFRLLRCGAASVFALLACISCGSKSNEVKFRDYYNTYTEHYITKDGKKFGKDSVYHDGEGGYDCMSEGFIRFIDWKTHNQGLFDRNGNVAVPAEYNSLSRVKGGASIARKGAQRDASDAEHHLLSGGEEMLIDTLNNVLIENFKFNPLLIMSSIEKTKTPSSDAIRESFLAKDGGYYSFINYKKEFNQWLANDLLLNLTQEKLIESSSDSIGWAEGYYLGKSDRQRLIADNFEILKRDLSSPNKEQEETDDWHISNNMHNIMYRCLKHRDSLPVIYIDVKGKDSLENNSYRFLRTGSGYKLESIHNKELDLKLSAEQYLEIANDHVKPNIESINMAIKYYRKAIELNPNLAEAYFNLGAVYECDMGEDCQCRGNKEKGQEYYKKAFELKPNMAD